MLEIMHFLFQDIAKEPILNFDPLPPVDSIDAYTTKPFRNTGTTSEGGRNGVLSMLFRSIFNDLNVPGNNPAHDQIREQLYVKKSYEMLGVCNFCLILSKKMLITGKLKELLHWKHQMLELVQVYSKV